MCTPPENTVIYRLFLSKTEKEDAGLDRDLTCLAVKCTELARQLSEDHVWHYEPFTLGVRPQGPEGIEIKKLCTECVCFSFYSLVTSIVWVY